MKTCKQKALEWGISERTVNDLCKKGRIPGAVKNGGRWQIPDEAIKPEDGRISSGRYVKTRGQEKLRSLPIGISDYARAQSEYYYVDKTLLIKEFLDKKPMVSLFTRPRRFGKTLNMDMLRCFFEISEEDTSKYFEDTMIWQCGDAYTSHQGKYPVIFLTFKDVKFDNWQATLDKIKDLLQAEFGRHAKILNVSQLADYEKEYFSKMLNGSASYMDLTVALEKLSKMLASYYGVAPIIIIDEYDTPIQEGYSKDFYNEIIDFMRVFFSGAFKDNRNLSYGFLTGILRIAQESIFSGLNNLSVNSIMDEDYSQFFGFTSSEVYEMLQYYGMTDKMEELKEWYDGGTEGFYHGLVLGLIALMDNQYRIKSNRESGDGRYDITMFPREKKYPGIIMEFKWKADLKEEEMEQFAADALRQIDEKRYDAELIELGVAPIFKLGIAFSGKRVKVKTI